MLNTQIHRQQSLVYVGRTRRETLRILGYAVDALRQADVILAKMANDLGWIRAGVLTYATRDNNIMMKDARPPLLSALGTAFSDVASLFVAEGETLGVVPSDEDDVSAPTVLANLYLPPVQLLLIVRLSMLDLVEGMGRHNDNMVHPGLPRSSEEDVDSTETATVASLKHEPDWVSVTLAQAEESMALMRHIAHPHPVLRAQALLLVGKLRLRRLQVLKASRRGTSYLSPGGTSDGHARDREGGQEQMQVKSATFRAFCRVVIENLEISARTALAAALRVSFQRGGHDWMLMRDACMSIVELQVESVDDDIHDRHSKTDGTEGGVARDGERSAAKESTVKLTAHYLRLAAAIMSGRRRLDAELGDMATEPLPAAVVDAMPRSALDELAGRSGKGPDDDRRRLDARGLLQFFRARIREKSLAAAPTDLLPASSVCQVHALLFTYFPPYRERCCTDQASLEPPPPQNTGSSVRSTSAATGGLPGSICVQWRWTDDPGATSDGDESSINNTSTRYKGNEHPAGVGTQIDGLFTTRSALMLLGPETGGASDPQDRENADAASIISFCVRASKAVAMKRGAAQLKTLLSAFRAKSEGADPLPVSLHDRIVNLLDEARKVFASAFFPFIGADTVNRDRANSSHDRGNGAGIQYPEMTVKTLQDVEGIFDTEAGVDVENQELCRFVRSAIGG
ncbi:unnamed protein product [Sphacelaria rigidula]